ncbi:hypothetical protein Avbf_18253 [Armadillidium vulgare]|nr:hypothetical protein Avbf_18253 [Armadillidium vulgare]
MFLNIFKTDDDLKWLESLLTIFHLFPLTNKKLTKIWGMKMKRWKFTLVNSAKYALNFTPDCINPGVGFGKPT